MTEIKVSAAGRTLEIGGKDTFSLTVILYLLAMASIAIKKELSQPASSGILWWRFYNRCL